MMQLEPWNGWCYGWPVCAFGCEVAGHFGTTNCLFNHRICMDLSKITSNFICALVVSTLFPWRRGAGHRCLRTGGQWVTSSAWGGRGCCSTVDLLKAGKNGQQSWLVISSQRSWSTCFFNVQPYGIMRGWLFAFFDFILPYFHQPC